MLNRIVLTGRLTRDPELRRTTSETAVAAGDDAMADYNRMKTSVMEEVKRMFKPEFINRIDDIMVFHALTNDDMKEIVTLLSKNLIDRCRNQMV